MSMRFAWCLGGMLALPPWSMVGAQDFGRPEQADTGHRIQTPFFSVLITSDWTVSVTPDSTAIHCERVEGGNPLMAKQVGSMLVGMLTATAEASTDPAAVAASYFDGEEARIKALEAQLPKEIGTWTKRKSKKIGPYALKYLDAVIVRWTDAGPLKQYEQHWLYFPPDFGSRHEYFAFLIVNQFLAGGAMEPWGGGVGEIQDVIRSFQDKRPAAVSAASPPGNSAGMASVSR